MTTATSQRQPELTRQTVVIGGSAGIVLETARRARAEGVGMILTGRNPDHLERAAAGLPRRIDHVMVTAVGSRGPISLGGLPCMS